MVQKAALALAAIILGAALAACTGPTPDNADRPGGQAPGQARLDSRLYQLVPPAGAPADSPSTPDNGNGASAPAPGSFPRSFLIPGTDTSIRIGGFFDATGASRAGP